MVEKGEQSLTTNENRAIGRETRPRLLGMVTGAVPLCFHINFSINLKAAAFIDFSATLLWVENRLWTAFSPPLVEKYFDKALINPIT